MLGILFLSACSPAQQITTEKVTCDPPLIKAGNGCCLDENSNYICDKDEIEEVEEEEKVTEPHRLRAGGKLRITEDDLPLKVFMQRNTHILYTIDGKEEVFIIDSMDKFRATIFYEQNRFKIDVGRTKPAGSLLIKYMSTDPPNGGNFAVLELQANANV
jgi:hypothetical protein